MGQSAIITRTLVFRVPGLFCWDGIGHIWVGFVLVFVTFLGFFTVGGDLSRVLSSYLYGTHGSICYYYSDPSVPCYGICYYGWDLPYIGGFCHLFGVCHRAWGLSHIGGICHGFCHHINMAICYYNPDPSDPCSGICHLGWDLSYIDGFCHRFCQLFVIFNRALDLSHMGGICHRVCHHTYIGLMG